MANSQADKAKVRAILDAVKKEGRDSLTAPAGKLICDAYGLSDRSGLLDAILWWQDRCWRGIEARAAAGDPAMTRLRDSGAARAVRGAFNWVTSHRAELAAPLG